MRDEPEVWSEMSDSVHRAKREWTATEIGVVTPQARFCEVSSVFTHQMRSNQSRITGVTNSSPGLTEYTLLLLLRHTSSRSDSVPVHLSSFRLMGMPTSRIKKNLPSRHNKGRRECGTQHTRLCGARWDRRWWCASFQPHSTRQNSGIGLPYVPGKLGNGV